MRAFVAIRPSEEAVEHLDAFLDVRRAAGPDLRWTQADQLHLTLAFLADVPERRVEDLLERLERAAARRTVFETRVAGGGAFPHVADARVVWAGLALDEEAAPRPAGSRPGRGRPPRRPGSPWTASGSGPT
jgi:RNA 2',3'-cyclic 3'-phosphodiesterase